MTCDKAIRLVEKLADGETNPGERAEAEMHLETCKECNSHYQFVRALESASEKIELPEPPEAYWQRFPSKVLTRIEREGREEREEQSGFWQKLFTPWMFRFGAAAATLTLVIAVGVSVYRDDPRQLESESSEMSEAIDVAQAPAAAPGKTAFDEKAAGSEDTAQRDPEEARASAPPAVARPPASAPARDVPLRSESNKLRNARPKSSPAPVAGDELDESRFVERAIGTAERDDVSDESLQEAPEPERLGRGSARSREPSPSESTFPEELELADTVSEDSARQHSVAEPQQAVRASSLAAGEAGSAVLASASGSCAEWRRYLAENDDQASEAREAHYQVALCSLRSYDAEPNDDTRDEATRDADAFLAIESDTERAEEIRLRLEPLRQ